MIISSEIKLNQFWTDLIQSDQKIYKVENLMIYFNDYFIRNQIESILIHFDQKLNKVENLMIYSVMLLAGGAGWALAYPEFGSSVNRALS